MHTYSGQVVDSTGAPVDIGKVFMTGENEGHSSPLDSDGEFVIDVPESVDVDLVVFFSLSDRLSEEDCPDEETVAAYTDNGIPSVFSVNSVSPPYEEDVDLETIELPPAYLVEVVVEDESGNDVTDELLERKCDTSILEQRNPIMSMSTNNGIVLGGPLKSNPVELGGPMMFTNNHSDPSPTKELVITEPQTVTLPLNADQ